MNEAIDTLMDDLQVAICVLGEIQEDGWTLPKGESLYDMISDYTRLTPDKYPLATIDGVKSVVAALQTASPAFNIFIKGIENQNVK